MQPTPHASTAQIIIELLLLAVLAAVFVRLAWNAHLAGLARVHRDEARILAGVRAAKAVELEPDGTQLAHVVPAPRRSEV